MERTRRAWLAWGLATCLYGCTVGPSIGELPAQCGDRSDNDDDGASDCDDTDCQALSMCSPPAMLSDASLPQIGDAFIGDASDPSDPPPIEPPIEQPPDEEPEPEPGPEPEPEPEPEPGQGGCDPGCAVNQQCVDDRCVDIDMPVPEVWTITQIEVSVPRSIDTDAAAAVCLDETCLGFHFPRAPYRSCACPPDPMVEVWVDLDSSDDEGAALAGATTVASDSDLSRWLEPIEIRVLASSTVQLKVFDSDGEAAEPIFGCAIAQALSAIASGEIECEQTFPMAGSANGVDFEISAQVVKAALD